MSYPLTLLLIIVLQGQAFKNFDIDAKRAFKAKEYQKALTLFQEAYRLQPKAKHYRVEGNFTDTYLPLYSIALCQEHLNIIEAEEWVEKSKIALEEDVIRKNRKKLAEYHTSLTRIIAAAKKEHDDADHAFKLAIEKANHSLQDNRFTMARQMFEALTKEHPDRPEAQAGIQSVDFAEKIFYQTKIQSLDLAISSNQVPAAEAILRQLKTSFPGRDLSAYEVRIEELVKPASVDIATAEEITPIVKPAQVKASIETDTKQNIENERNRAVEDAKHHLRTQLIAILSSFKKVGDPDLALNKLSKIPEDQLKPFASYHWLKAILLAYSAQKSGELSAREEAIKHIRIVYEKGYKPELKTSQYPAFFISMANTIDGENK